MLSYSSPLSVDLHSKDGRRSWFGARGARGAGKILEPFLLKFKFFFGGGHILRAWRSGRCPLRRELAGMFVRQLIRHRAWSGKILEPTDTELCRAASNYMFGSQPIGSVACFSRQRPENLPREYVLCTMMHKMCPALPPFTRRCPMGGDCDY